MSLFRRSFSRRLPDRLLEISERIYVFDCCLSTTPPTEREYKSYLQSVVTSLQTCHPGASFMVFNFREGNEISLLSDILIDYDMTVVDYPRHLEGYPLLPLEMIHYFLRSGESWLSLEGQKNVILMHCERGGWPVLAFMLAGLLLYRKQYSGEQKTLEMVYKQAPKEVYSVLSPINPRASQMRYLEYITGRDSGSGSDSDWPPSDVPLVVDYVLLRNLPLFDNGGGKGCRPVVRVYGHDGSGKGDRSVRLLFSSLMAEEPAWLYSKEECAFVKLQLHCQVQGDVFLECIHLYDDLVSEDMIFKVMFHTGFIKSNLLALNSNEIDVPWNAQYKLPKDFKAELLFRDMNEDPLNITMELGSGGEEYHDSESEFFEVDEIFTPESQERKAEFDTIIVQEKLIDDDFSTSNQDKVIDDDFSTSNFSTSNQEMLIDDDFSTSNQEKLIDDNFSTSNQEKVIDDDFSTSDFSISIQEKLIEDEFSTSNQEKLIDDDFSTSNQEELFDDNFSASNLSTSNQEKVIDDDFSTSIQEKLIEDDFGTSNQEKLINDDFSTSIQDKLIDNDFCTSIFSASNQEKLINDDFSTSNQDKLIDDDFRTSIFSASNQKKLINDDFSTSKQEKLINDDFSASIQEKLIDDEFSTSSQEKVIDDDFSTSNQKKLINDNINTSIQVKLIDDDFSASIQEKLIDDEFSTSIQERILDDSKKKDCTLHNGSPRWDLEVEEADLSTSIESPLDESNHIQTSSKSEAKSDHVIVSAVPKNITVIDGSQVQEVKVEIEPIKPAPSSSATKPKHKKNKWQEITAKTIKQQRAISEWVPRTKPPSPDQSTKPKPPVYKWVPKGPATPE